MSRTEIASLACRLLALAMFAMAAAVAIPFLAGTLSTSPSLWTMLLFTAGFAVLGVAGIWLLFAVYYWQRADVLARRMVDNDPEPVSALNFTSDDVLAAGCRIVGIVTLIQALRIAADLAAVAALSQSEVYGSAVFVHLPSQLLKAGTEAAIGGWLLFGARGIVNFLISTGRAGTGQASQAATDAAGITAPGSSAEAGASANSSPADLDADDAGRNGGRP
jgi:hypothetical protein